MKRLLIVFFALAACTLVLSAQTVIKYSGGANWYPIFPVDKDGKMLVDKGVGNDLMAELAKRMGIKVELQKDIPWARLWMMIDEGSLDLMVGAGMTDERREKYIEIESFMDNDYRLFVKVGKEFPFSSLADLRGKSLAMARGAKFGPEFDEFIADPKNNVKINEVSGGKANTFPMLDLGRIDAVPMDVYDGTYGATALGLEGKIKALPKSIGLNPIYCYLSKKSPWAPKAAAISQAIKDMKKDGTLAKILAKY